MEGSNNNRTVKGKHMVDKFGLGNSNKSNNVPRQPNDAIGNASGGHNSSATGNNVPRQAADPVGEPNVHIRDTSGYKPDTIHDMPRQPGETVIHQPAEGTSHQINGQPANEFYKDNYGDGWEKQFKNDHGFEPNETGSQEAFDRFGADQNYQPGMENGGAESGSTGNIGGVENATDGMVDTVGEGANASAEISAEVSTEIGAEVAGSAVEVGVAGAEIGASAGAVGTASSAGITTASTSMIQSAFASVSSMVTSTANALGITSTLGTQVLAGTMALTTAGALGGGGALVGSALMNSSDVARYESIVCEPKKVMIDSNINDDFEAIQIDEKKLEVLAKIHSVVLAYGGDEIMTGAIAGNFEVESRMDPTALESLPGIEPFYIGPQKQAIIDADFKIGNGLTQCGTGLGQWSTGENAGNRGQQLRDKAEELGLDVFSAEAQLIYMFGFDDDWTINTLARMRDNAENVDVKEMTYWFMAGWEGLDILAKTGGDDRYADWPANPPWSPKLQEREEYAEKYALLAKEMTIDTSYGESIISQASIDGVTVARHDQALNESDGCDGKVGNHYKSALPVLNFEGKSTPERIAILFDNGLPSTYEEAMTYVETFKVPIYNEQGKYVQHNITMHKMLKQDTINIFSDMMNAGFKIYSAGGMDWRMIAGTDSRSWHSYGLTIDINADDNGHEVDRERWDIDRHFELGNEFAIHPGGIAEQAFKKRHWFWGGDWSVNNKDYMHFNAAGPH